MRISAFVASVVMLLLTAWWGGGCNHQKPLTASERQKLDPALEALLLGEGTEAYTYGVVERSDGSKEYDVIIRTTNVEVLRDHAVQVRSDFGDVVTARATREVLRDLVALPQVRYIENPDDLHTQ